MHKYKNKSRKNKVFVLFFLIFIALVAYVLFAEVKFVPNIVEKKIEVKFSE